MPAPGPSASSLTRRARVPLLMLLLTAPVLPIASAARPEASPVLRGITRFAQAVTPQSETYGAIVRRFRAMGPSHPAVPLPERLRGINPPANELLTPDLQPGAAQQEFVSPPGRRAAAAPRPRAAVRPRATPPSETEFDTIADTGSVPPDDAFAASSTHLVTAANSALQVRSLTGTLLGASSFNSFFPTEPTRFIFDPRLCFDTATNRFYFCAVGRNGGSQTSTIVVAVTAGSDPTGTWHKYVFTVTRNGAAGAEWGDYPSLGFDDNALYVSVNMFTFASNQARGTRTLIMNKATAMAGGALTPTVLEDLLLPSPPFVANSAAFTLKPAEAATPLTQGMLICNAGQFGLCLFRITSPLGTPSVTSTFIDTTDFPIPGNAPQLGSATELDSGDFRLQKTVFRSGVIWTCHTVSSSGASFGRAMCLFHLVDASSATLLDSIPIDDDTRSYYYPAIVPDTSGNAMAVFQGSATNEFPSIYHARYVAALNDFEAPVLTEASSTAYAVVVSGRNRWGDYTDACLDPRNGSKVWIQGQLTQTTTTWRKRAALVPVTTGAPIADAYEPDDSAIAAAVIAPGETQSRSIHAVGNQDWAKFTLAATSHVTVGSTDDTSLDLFGPNSSTSLIDSDPGDGTGAAVQGTNLGAGTYYIRCEQSDGSATIQVYQLSLVVTPVAGGDAFEPDDSAATAGVITDGAVQNRTIHVIGNEDWAKFTMPSTGSFTAEASDDTEMWVFGPNDPDLEVGYDPGTGAVSRVTATAQPAGTYYIRTREFENNALIAAYTLRLTITAGGVTADAFEPDDVPAASKIIASGDTQNRTIHAAGNEDWARFIVSSSVHARIETTGAAGDTILRLFGPDEDDQLLREDDDSGSGQFSLIDTSSGAPLSPGVYWIQVSEFGSDGTVTAYQLLLTLTLAPDVFEPDNVSTEASEIAPGEEQARNIHANADEDWAFFILDTPSTVTIETSGTVGDTVMELFGPNDPNNLIEADDDDGDGTFSLIQRAGSGALAAGTYWVRVTEFLQNSSIATYTLSLEAAPAPGFSITAPNGGEALVAGSTVNVTWTSQNYAGAVTLEYSLNNGASWVRIIASTPNDGVQRWRVPAVSSSTARVRIRAKIAGDAPFDASDAAFTIQLAGKLKLKPPSAAFGRVRVGTTKDVSLQLQNTGAGPLQVEVLAAGAGPFAVQSGGGAFVIPPRSVRATPLVLRFSPTARGAASLVIQIRVNEATRSQATLRATGTGT